MWDRATPDPWICGFRALLNSAALRTALALAVGFITHLHRHGVVPDVPVIPCSGSTGVRHSAACGCTFVDHG
jgi:hypothetical protein